MERARVEKLVGSSLEAKVMLHVGDADVAAALTALQAAANGVDELQYLFLVSLVRASAGRLCTIAVARSGCLLLHVMHRLHCCRALYC